VNTALLGIGSQSAITNKQQKRSASVFQGLQSSSIVKRTNAELKKQEEKESDED
jgi:hypothetical protein